MFARSVQGCGGGGELTPSLPEPVSIWGWKLHVRPKNGTFSSPSITDLPLILCIFVGILSRANAKRKRLKYFRSRTSVGNF